MINLNDCPDVIANIVHGECHSNASNAWADFGFALIHDLTFYLVEGLVLGFVLWLVFVYFNARVVWGQKFRIWDFVRGIQKATPLIVVASYPGSRVLQTDIGNVRAVAKISQSMASAYGLRSKAVPVVFSHLHKSKDHEHLGDLVTIGGGKNNPVSKDFLARLHRRFPKNNFTIRMKNSDLYVKDQVDALVWDGDDKSFFSNSERVFGLVIRTKNHDTGNQETLLAGVGAYGSELSAIGLVENRRFRKWLRRHGVESEFVALFTGSIDKGDSLEAKPLKPELLGIRKIVGNRILPDDTKLEKKLLTKFNKNVNSKPLGKKLVVRGLLFDNDGVLVDSHQAAIDAWSKWCDVYSPGLDWDAQGTAGVRAEDMVRMWAPAEKFSEANDYINALELETAGSTIAMPGSLALLSSLPDGSWTICTSANRALGLARVSAAGLPVPKSLVSGDDVAHGKPHPDPYQMGAARLGLAPVDCVVFEDAVAGVEAARAAGVGFVVGIGNRVIDADVDCVILSLDGITFQDGVLTIPESSLLKGN